MSLWLNACCLNHLLLSAPALYNQTVQAPQREHLHATGVFECILYSILTFSYWMTVNCLNDHVVTNGPAGVGGFHRLLLHSMKPLILPKDMYVFCLAEEQHVLIKVIEHYPAVYTLIPVREGGGGFGLLPAGGVMSKQRLWRWLVVHSVQWFTGDWLLWGAVLKRRGLPQSSLPASPLTTRHFRFKQRLRGLQASGPQRTANPIPAGQQSIWLVAPAGL